MEADVKRLGYITAGIIRDLRRRRHVERLHELGPRALDELLIEIGAERSCLTSMEMTLERYSGLSRDVIAAVDGDRFWPAPLYEVQPSPEPPGRSGNRAITRDSTA